MKKYLIIMMYCIINDLNIASNKENLGRLLAIDLNKLSKSDLIEEDLRTIKTEGLGYDYLNEEVVHKISRKTVGEENIEYQEKKRQVIGDIALKAKTFVNTKEELISRLNSNNVLIRNAYIKKSIFATKLLSTILVPIITFNAGHMIGKNASEKITEYKTVTQTVDLNTGEIIGEPNIVYDERETTYMATVMEHSPWRKNPIGSGYISNVIAYEYKVPDNIPEDYHVTSEDLTGNLLEKYNYIESKNILEDGDNTEDSTILIIETFQDKNVNQKS